MKLTVLGSGTYEPTTERGCSGYLLEVGRHNCLIDIGSGVLRQLAKCSFSPSDISHLFISHLHTDHIADIAPFLFCRRNKSADKDLKIIGPPRLKDFIENLSKSFGDWILNEVIFENIIEVSNLVNLDISFSAKPFLVDHKEYSFGYRFESSGKSFSYSGDTGYCDNLIDLFQNVDLALCECTGADVISGHLSPSEVGKIAEESQCSKVVLTHISPDTKSKFLVDRCRKHFSGDVVVANDLQTFQI